MKKKFLGLILALVVLMIVPMVVSAAETDPVLTITDSIVEATGEKTAEAVKIEKEEIGTIYVAENGYFKPKLSITNLPSGATVDFSTDNLAGISYTKVSNTLTITGAQAGKTVEFTVTVKKGNETTTFTCNVEVIERKTYAAGYEIDPAVKAEDVQKLYEAGDAFDFSDIRLNLKYVDDKSSVAEKAYFNATTGRKFTGEHKMVYGQTKFKVTYDGKETEFDFGTAKIYIITKKKVSPVVTKKTYYYGEKFDAKDLTLKVEQYDDTGATVRRKYTLSSGDYEFVSPKTAITTDTKGVTIKYDTKEYTWTWKQLGITISQDKRTIKNATVQKFPDKTIYEVDDSFDPAGMKILVTYLDQDGKEFTETLETTSPDFPTITKKFTSTSDNTVKITVVNPYNSENTVELSIEVTVKAKSVPTEIINVSYTKLYYAGQKAVYDDIDNYTVTMSDGKTMTKKDIDALIKTGGDGKPVVTLIPNTTLTEKNESLTLSLAYKGKTITKTLAIDVEMPACIVTASGGSLGEETYYFESLEFALEKANTITSQEAKAVVISLNGDIELTKSYTFNAQRSITINLNGNALTMARNQLLVPHNDVAYALVEIVLLNNVTADAVIKYDATDKNEWIYLGKGESIVIDYETETPGVYEITLEKAENGSITGPIEVAHGNDAKYTFVPDEGYEVDQIYVDGEAQGKGETYNLENITAAHTISVTFKKIAWKNPFKDVYKAMPYYDSIAFVYENGLFEGVSATMFEPDETMTRAMFVTVLGRLAGISEYDSRYTGTSAFSDVKYSEATSWYVPYVAWATEKGLLLGYEDGTFRPNNEISHTEMYILMERFARKIIGVTTLASSTSVTVADKADIPTWDGAMDAVKFATKYNFLVKDSNKITPNADAKRHELATLLMSFCDTFKVYEK